MEDLKCKSNKITPKGYIISKTPLTTSEITKIRTSLTVSPFVPKHLQKYTGRPPKIKLYQESTHNIYIPRYYGIKHYGMCPSSMPKVSSWPPTLEFNGTLRPNQLEPMQSVLKQVLEVGGGLLCVKPGDGKTVMALWLSGLIRKKTAIVVHTGALCEQWADRIKKFIPGARVGIIQGSRFEYEDQDFVVIMLQTLWGRKWKSSQCKQLYKFGLLVIDECHHMAAEKFSIGLRRIGAQYTLGLTATPDRDDRLTHVFEWYLGDIAFRSKTETRQANVYRVTYKPVDVEEKYNNRGQVNTQAMLTDLCNDTWRTRWIANKAIERWMSGERYIIILSHRRQHVYDIHEMIENDTRMKHAKAVVFTGGMSNDVLEGADVIVATYSMAEEGLDVPRLNMLIYATPKKSMNTIQQSSGRILRALNPKQVPEIYDICDGYSIFKRWATGRLKYYKKCNWTIHESNIF